MPSFQAVANKALPLGGRILVAFLFIAAGVSKLLDIPGTVSFIDSVGLPFSYVLAILTIALEIGVGFALALGLYTKASSIVLAIFTILASVIFHPFWAVPLDQQFITQLLFFKNIAITGGLLTMASFGPGDWSLDARQKPIPA